MFRYHGSGRLTIEMRIAFLFYFFLAFANNDNAIYSYNNYEYNQYDLEQLVMSDDCRKVDELLQLVALKAGDNSYVLNSIVGNIKGYTGFDPRIRTQREELACDIASKNTKFKKKRVY